MLKRMVGITLAVLILGLAGCKNLTEQLRSQNANLTDQLVQCQQERDALLSKIDALDAEGQGLQAKLDDALAQAQQAKDLGEQLQQERARLQQQRQELQTLVQGLSGISVEPGREGNYIVVENDILFPLGEATLNQQAEKALDKVAQYLEQRPAVSIRVDGHTDGVPISSKRWEDNHHLSVMRAHSVMKYLESKGVNSTRMSIMGFGPNRPRVKPETPTAPTAKNRRVEILVIPEKMESVEDILQRFQQ